MIEIKDIAYDLQDYANDCGYMPNNFDDMLEHVKVNIDMIDDSKMTDAERDAYNSIVAFVYNIHA